VVVGGEEGGVDERDKWMMNDDDNGGRDEWMDDG